jgi:ABC-type nitrate/sulfonate/bicarbonate transport system substrate-binding protein
LKSSNIQTPANLRHKKIGFYNSTDSHFSLFALLQKYNISLTDITLEEQYNKNYLNSFLSGSLPSVAVSSLNEIGQLLQTKVDPPISGAPGLYLLENFTIFDFFNEGVGMLEDGIIANKWWLEDVTNQDIAGNVTFIYCG